MSNNVSFSLIRKFAPGQIIFTAIDTAKLDGEDNKERPYLIISSNNTRLVVLRITQGGLRASNWIFPCEGMGKDGKTSNIILDCPITVDIDRCVNIKHYGNFTPDQFRKIMQWHMAAMNSQGTPDFMFTTEDIVAVKSISENHTDAMKKFSVQSILRSTPEGNTSRSTATVEVKENRDEPTKADLVTTIVSAQEKADAVLLTEQAKEVPQPKERDIKPLDLFILSSDKRTKDTDCYAELARVGIKDPKFVMSRLINEKKVVYLNNRYNVLLKSKQDRHSVKDYEKRIIQDCMDLGIKNAALVWGVAYIGVWRIFDKYRRRCS